MANYYLNRKIDNELSVWSRDSNRKPLLVRGARQVGKTASVRKLAEQFEHFIEINFEEQKQVHQLFSGDISPGEICENLSIFYNTPVVEGKTLLFFDEIQSCIPAISSLRFFYEKLPAVHLVAAGSLLEFAFEEILSFGVGRVRSFFMHPFSFDEFLLACGEELLLKAKHNASIQNPLSLPLHQKLVKYLKRFMVLGGMPEVVVNFVKNKDVTMCQSTLNDLTFSLKDDFAKYKKRVPELRISEIFESIVQQSGGKFIYSKAITQANHRQIKEAVDLLIKAGLVIPVTHTSANGLPLGAESNVKKRKLLIFDTGIFQCLLGLNISDFIFSDDFQLINKGSLAEQFVGLEILKASSCYSQTNLYYWHREALNSNAEVDYVINKSDNIIPVEVKSGTKVSMRSMYIFLDEKKRNTGCRFSLEPYTSYNKIVTYPLYAVSAYMSL